MRTYSPDFKAQVIAEWMAGSPAKALARQHKMPESTVRVWTHGLARASVTPESKHDIDTLVTELVTVWLMGLQTVGRLSLDEAWVRTQSIEGLTAWFGTTADKLFGLLAAYKGPRTASEPAQLAPGPGEDR